MAVRKHGVFVASTVKSVELGAAAEDGVNVAEVVEVEVVSEIGTAPIYWTVDGSIPAVKGDDTYVTHINGRSRALARGELPITVKMICAATDTYGVEVFTA